MTWHRDRTRVDEKMLVEAIAIDVDGTMAPPEGPVNLDALNVIRRCEREGITVIVCSGRSLQYLLGIARALGTGGPIIAENGAIVFDSLRRRRILLGKSADVDKLRAMLGEALPEARMLAGVDQKKEVILTAVPQRGTSMKKLYDRLRKLTSEKRLRVDVILTKSTVDVLPQSVDKGEGLKVAARICGINRRAVAAIGDCMGDIPLLKAAGFGVAVADAQDELKAIADYVCRRTNGEGVAEAISLILERKL